MKKLSVKKGKRKTLHLIPPIILAIISMQAYAMDYSVLKSIKAYPPYHIKPNTPHLFPSGLTPAQMRKAYGYDQIVNQGEGQIIAIVDAYDNPNAEADLGVFNTTFNLPACTTANGCFKKIYANGSQPAGDIGWGVEIALDVQWAHAIAPKAKVILVEAADSSFTNLFKAINVAVQNGANVVSMSWGGGEFSGQNQFDSTFNVPGVEFFASTGDSGSGVIYPSTSPNVIAVGGTTLNVDASGNYISESAWAGSGGGLSAFETEPAYQTNFPLPNNPSKMRGVPDISGNADPNTGVSVYDSYGGYGWVVVGGTSASAPETAAMVAIAKSTTATKLTGVNAMLYTLGQKSYSTLYHDITSGSNGSCGYYCNTQTGYDYVTGLGTPKGAALIKAIAGNVPPPPPPGDRIPI